MQVDIVVTTIQFDKRKSDVTKDTDVVFKTDIGCVKLQGR